VVVEVVLYTTFGLCCWDPDGGGSSKGFFVVVVVTGGGGGDLIVLCISTRIRASLCSAINEKAIYNRMIRMIRHTYHVI